MGLVTDSPGYSCSASKKSHIWSKWTPHRKKCFLSGISQITSPPNSGKLYNFFGCQKRRFSTYYKTNDYDNDGSDNCDYNFGTFDNFGVKNDQKVSHNMILMSRYTVTWWKRAKNSGKAPPPFGQCPKENVFFCEVFPNTDFWVSFRWLFHFVKRIFPNWIIPCFWCHKIFPVIPWETDENFYFWGKLWRMLNVYSWTGFLLFS